MCAVDKQSARAKSSRRFTYFAVHCLRIPSHLLIFAVHSEPNPLRAFEAARQRASDRRHSMLNKCGVVLVLFRRNGLRAVADPLRLHSGGD